jgi:DNA repair protein RadC
MLQLETDSDSYEHTRLDYHATVRELPSNERPRERLQHFGPQALSMAELLAIVLRTGTRGDNALELANKLLTKYGGLPGLVRADFRELCAEHGMGVAKSAQVKAALEVGADWVCCRWTPGTRSARPRMRRIW